MTASEAPAKPVSLDHDEIQALLPHRWPMLLLDRIDHAEPGRSGVGVKNVTATELWFQGHFPGEALLPGVVVLEAMAQLAGAVFALGGAGRVSYLAGVRSMRYRQRIVPGDQVTLHAERTAGGAKFAEFRVAAKVGGHVAAEGLLSIADAGDGASRKVMQ